jgi:hypothetical protein
MVVLVERGKTTTRLVNIVKAQIPEHRHDVSAHAPGPGTFARTAGDRPSLQSEGRWW